MNVSLALYQYGIYQRYIIYDGDYGIFSLNDHFAHEHCCIMLAEELQPFSSIDYIIYFPLRDENRIIFF